jgi:hypothetical protein
MRRTRKISKTESSSSGGGGGMMNSPPNTQRQNTPTPPNIGGGGYKIQNPHRKSPTTTAFPGMMLSSPGKGFYAGAKFETEPRPCAIPTPPLHWTTSSCRKEMAAVENHSDSYKLVDSKFQNLQMYTCNLKHVLNIL